MAPNTKKSPKRREPLTRDRIELAALTVIDREGLQQFSTRKLARDLGCEAMSIYHHFPSVTHLLNALVDRLVREMIPPPGHLPWEEQIRHVCDEYRAMALRHPPFFPHISVHRMNTPTALIWLDRVISIFRNAGFDDEQAARIFRIFGYYMMGACLDETMGYAKGPSTAEPVSDEAMNRDFPNVVAAGPFFRPNQVKATFDLGLKLIIEAARAEDRQPVHEVVRSLARS